MDRNRFNYLRKKLRNNRATDEEKKELESFSIKHADQTVLHGMEPGKKEAIKISILNGIRKKVASHDTAATATREFDRHWLLLRVAASITLVAVASFLWLHASDSHQTVRTAYGKHLAVSLPDGSQVILNGNSVLRMEKEWDSVSAREVWIEGEAFFDVRHTAGNTKFIVHTGENLNIEVLGTRFNVKVRPGQNEVMLEKGKVALTIPSFFAKKSVTLQPGDMVRVDEGNFFREKVDPVAYSSWKEHRLYFHETTLREIANILRDTYGVHTVFGSDTIANRKLSGQIECRSSAEILSIIEASLDLRVRQTDGHVLITKE